MTTFHITPIYIALAAVLYLAMTYFIIRNRRARRISLGDGGDQSFARHIRGHGNFAEYTPFALIALAAAELSGADAALLHVAGGLLIAGRTLHGYCFMLTPGSMALRVAGMAMTIFAIAIGSAAGLYAAVGA